MSSRALPILALPLLLVAACGDRTSSTQQRLVYLQLSPSNPALALGNVQQLAATGVYADGATVDLTPRVTWSSSAQDVATISAQAGSEGLVSAVGPGSATITARLGDVSGAATVVVAATPLVHVVVSPDRALLTPQATLQFTATGLYADGTTADLTSRVTWSSSAEDVATFLSTGDAGRARGVGLGGTMITASQGGVSGRASLVVSAIPLVYLLVEPDGAEIAPLGRLQFTATGVFADGSTRDLTSGVTWSSSAEAVATVSAAAGSEGLASAVAPGAALVVAAVGSTTGQATLTVAEAALLSLVVTPPAPVIFTSGAKQFTALGLYADGSTRDVTRTVAWTSSHAAVATISSAPGSAGLASAVAPGGTDITATSPAGLSGTTTLEVIAPALSAISVTPSLPLLVVGGTHQLTATGLYADGSVADLTQRVAWSAQPLSVATVTTAAGSAGLVTAVESGNALLTASSGTVSGVAFATVAPVRLTSLAVTPADPSLGCERTLQFRALGSFSDGSQVDVTSSVSWSSSAPGVATFSASQGSEGVATALATGTATVTATAGTITGATTLTVTLLTTGETCGTDGSCATGMCRNGRCCATECSGLCKSCAAPGQEGICANAPRNAPSGGGCGLYTCDGNGGCQTTCLDSSLPCDPYVAYCPRFFGMPSPRSCQGKLGLGQSCWSRDYCVSGICSPVTWGETPGRCTAVNCPACTAPDTRGVCLPCGPYQMCRDGRCVPLACPVCQEADGAGGCRPAASGTDPGQDCGLYTCNGAGACNTSCEKDAWNCSPSCKSWCWDGQCQGALAGGQSCIGNCQCASGTCGFPWVCY